MSLSSTQTVLRSVPRRAAWFGVIAASALLVSACVGSASTPVSTPQTSVTSSTPAPDLGGETQRPRPPRGEVSERTAPGANLTVSQREAVESAQSYLSFSAFSRSGLIGQLEYEGFATSDATFAVDSLNVDWNRQAVESAKSYLKSSAFSLSGLVDQLEYEGFTAEQAQFGAQQAYSGNGGGAEGSSGGSASQRNAIASARSYLEYSSFSRSGLIDQLEYEGYSTADATFAVDSLNVNWNEQAAKSARSYLEYSSFSRSSLKDQLIYEGFSSSQAEYGVSRAGL